MSEKTTAHIWIAMDSNQNYEVGPTKIEALNRYMDWFGEENTDADVRCVRIDAEMAPPDDISVTVDIPGDIGQTVKAEAIDEPAGATP